MILFNPGEDPALDDYGRSDYLGFTADNTLTGQYAKAVGGAGIVLEHRYWGKSTPVSNLTVDNLRFHTIDQAIQDMVYFANNVKLPFDHNGSANADKCVSPPVFDCQRDKALTCVKFQAMDCYRRLLCRSFGCLDGNYISRNVLGLSCIKRSSSSDPEPRKYNSALLALISNICSGPTLSRYKRECLQIVAKTCSLSSNLLTRS